MATTSVYPPAVHAMANHIITCSKAHRVRFSARSNCPPLFVGVQGPQGSGKTFLTSRLCPLLADTPDPLSVAVLSIDDLYLPHDGLSTLAEAHPRNRLLHGRGQPGTHDIALGCAVMSALKMINDGAEKGAVSLPMFDKSLYDGAGDRTVEMRVVSGPLDVLVLEGWCVGFYPLPRGKVEGRWAQWAKGMKGLEFDLQGFVGVDEVLEVNEMLAAYVGWWEALDAFIQIRGPPEVSLAIIYQWRLQQEQDMKGKNGGRGMTDEQVKTFVDRYIPGYVFFGDGVTEGMVDERGRQTIPPWQGQGLVLEVDQDRQLMGTSRF